MKKQHKIIAKTACLCYGKMHRLLVNDKLQLLAPSHDIRAERAAKELAGEGYTLPRCLRLIEAWRLAAKTHQTRRTSRFSWSRDQHFILPVRLAHFYKKLIKTRHDKRRRAGWEDILAVRTNGHSYTTKKEYSYRSIATMLVSDLLQAFGLDANTRAKVQIHWSSRWELTSYWKPWEYYSSAPAIVKTFLEHGPRAMLQDWHYKTDAGVLGPVLVFIVDPSGLAHGITDKGAVVAVMKERSK